MACSMPVTALACTQRRVKFNAACAMPSPIAATPMGSSRLRSPSGPTARSISALVSSGITRAVPTEAHATASMTINRPR